MPTAEMTDLDLDLDDFQIMMENKPLCTSKEPHACTIEATQRVTATCAHIQGLWCDVRYSFHLTHAVNKLHCYYCPENVLITDSHWTITPI